MRRGGEIEKGGYSYSYSYSYSYGALEPMHTLAAATLPTAGCLTERICLTEQTLPVTHPVPGTHLAQMLRSLPETGCDRGENCAPSRCTTPGLTTSTRVEVDGSSMSTFVDVQPGGRAGGTAGRRASE